MGKIKQEKFVFFILNVTIILLLSYIIIGLGLSGLKLFNILPTLVFFTFFHWSLALEKDGQFLAFQWIMLKQFT